MKITTIIDMVSKLTLFVVALVAISPLVCPVSIAGEEAEESSRLAANLHKCEAVVLLRCLAVTKDLRSGHEPEPDDLHIAYTCEVVETLTVVPGDEPWLRRLSQPDDGTTIVVFIPENGGPSLHWPGFPDMDPDVAYLAYLLPCPVAAERFRGEDPLDPDRCFMPLPHPSGTLEMGILPPGISDSYDARCLRDYGSVDPRDILRGVRRVAACLTGQTPGERLTALISCLDDPADPVASRAAAVLLRHEELPPMMTVPAWTEGPGLLRVAVAAGDIAGLTDTLRKRGICVGVARRAEPDPVEGEPIRWTAVTLKDLVEKTLAPVDDRSARYGVDSVYLGLDGDPLLAGAIVKPVISNERRPLAWTDLIRKVLPPLVKLDKSPDIPADRMCPEERTVKVDIQAGTGCAEALLQICAAYGEGMSFDLVPDAADAWKISFHCEQQER